MDQGKLYQSEFINSYNNIYSHDIENYKDQLSNRLDPSMSIMQGINAQVKKRPKTVVFAEGEDPDPLQVPHVSCLPTSTSF